MTPEEKAKELVYNFRKQFDWVESDYPIDLYRDTRQCAIIAVDEILKVLDDADDLIYYRSKFNFWTEVKKEIENL
jgi:hypothetical protein